MTISTEHSLGVDPAHELPPSHEHQGSFVEVPSDSRNFVRSNAAKVLTAESAPPHLTAQAFADSLKDAARSVRLDDLNDFQVTDIPASTLESLQMKFANVWEDHNQLDSLRGLLPEIMLPSILRRRLPGNMSQLRQMRAADIDLHDESFQVRQGLEAHEVCFEKRRDRANLESFIEFDSLHQISSSGEYVAFDPTFRRVSFETGKRTNKLRTLSELLGKNIVLIDIILKNGNFCYQKISENMYRWHLPLCIEMDDVIEQVIPMTRGRMLLGSRILTNRRPR